MAFINRISEEQINNVRQSVDIVDIVSRYIPLTKKGRNYFGVCPFHDDTDPSLSVSPEKQIYKCFSCGASGNVFSFIMDYENLSFIESLKKTSDIAGIDLNISTNLKPEKNKELYEIYELANKFYKNNLETQLGLDAKDYLKKRNIDEDLIHEFEIGLSISKNPLNKFLNSKNLNEDDIIKSGLINDNKNDVFYDRIMFPIQDTNGKIVGFSGRIYKHDDTSKYINTKETPIFKKGELLFNYHRAKNEGRKEKSIIVLEGFMDVISLHAVGIKNTIATMGTAVTLTQARLIKKLNSEVILLFDGDQAGEKATLSCIDELNKVGISAKVVRLEDNLDPDDYIKEKGIEKFREKLEKRESAIDFKIDVLKKNKNLDNSTDMAEYANAVLEELNKIDDEVLKTITLKKLSEETDLEITFLKNKIKDSKKEKVEKEIFEKPRENKYSLAEKYLIYYMLRSKEVIKMYRRKITFMPSYEYRLLAIEISEFLEKNGYIEIADIFSIVSDNEKMTKTLKDVMKLDLNEEYSEEEIEDYINVINEYNLKYELNGLKEKMKSEKDLDKKNEIAEKIRLLKSSE